MANSRRGFIALLGAIGTLPVLPARWAARNAAALQLDRALALGRQLGRARIAIATLDLTFDSHYSFNDPSMPTATGKETLGNGRNEFFLDIPNSRYKLVHYRADRTLIKLCANGRYTEWAESAPLVASRTKEESPPAPGHAVQRFAANFLRSWVPGPRNAPIHYRGTEEFRGESHPVIAQGDYEYLVSESLAATLRLRKYYDAERISRVTEFTDHLQVAPGVNFPLHTTSSAISPETRQTINTMEFSVTRVRVNESIPPSFFVR